MINTNGSERRVVVTGLGVVTASGCDVPTFWKNVLNGVSGAAQVTRFDAGNDPTRIAAEVRGFVPTQYMDKKTARRLDRSLLYSVAAAKMAAEDAKLDMAQMNPDRVGIVEGTTMSSNETAARAELAYTTKGYRSVSPMAMFNGYCGAGSGEIALELGCKGHAITCCSGSASGNDVMGYAMNMIQTDETDVMLAGGAEAPILPQVWGGFCHTRVMTRNNENPAGAMRPFDKHRDGFLLGEGAGFIVVEELSHALARNARIYAEILGHGRSCEAYHTVAPHPDGIGVYRAMEKALRNARLHASEVDYINAHGTATEANDVVETLAIKRFFGEQAKRLAVSSTKPVTGHLLAGAGAVETIICALALHHQIIPLTLNLKEPEAGCDLDYVSGHSRPYPLRVALNLSSGFGGKNSCLALGRYAERT